MSSIAHDGTDELAEFVHRWSEAIVANDVGRMDDFVTDDWVLVDRPGPITKQAFHDAVASGVLRHDAMTHEVLEVRRLASDVAVLVTHGRNRGSFRGEPIEADEWTTDILVKRPDGWRCVLTQLTPRVAGMDGG